MAIDTQNKRRSVAGYSGLRIAPVADGTVAKPDREHMVGLYSGIAVGGGGGPSFVSQQSLECGITVGILSGVA